MAQTLKDTPSTLNIISLSKNVWRYLPRSPFFSVSSKFVRQSLRVLRKVVQPDVPLIVNFSGGKDSLACLSLALAVTDRVECLYMDGGMDLPMTLPYVEKVCREWGVKLHVSHPARDRIQHKTIPKNVCLLPDYVRHWGYFPTSAKRYCGCWLKHRPARVHLRKIFSMQRLYKIVGIRLDESGVRRWKYGSLKAIRKYGGKYVRADQEHSGSFLVFPILNWTKQGVEAYLKRQNVEVHEGYKLFGMSGCKWCPVAKPWQIRAIAKTYPGIYDDLVEAERDINKPAWQHKNLWLKDLITSDNLSLEQFLEVSE